MRFISVNTLNPTNRLPTEAEMASMQKFIVEGMKAGVADRMRGRDLWHHRRPRAQSCQRRGHGHRRPFRRD